MITLRQIPVLDDNYVYLLWDDEVRTGPGGRPYTLVVDPALASPVLDTLEHLGLDLGAVVVTHPHGDHVGGVAELVDATRCEVVGNERDRNRIPHLGRVVRPGDSLELGPFRLRVLDVAAHTLGHVAYALDAHVDGVVRHGHGGRPTRIEGLSGRPAIFVGDSLFGAGCGRLFEGGPADLHRSLTTLANEDPRSLVCCAHEYTRSNLAFAAHAYPDTPAVRARLERFSEELGESGSSIPSILSEELATNPFLLGLREPDPIDRVFALRKAKDTFKSV